MRERDGAERVAGPLRAGDAQPALARLPAGARRTHGTRERERRQLLDVAAGDVRVSRPDRRRRVRGDRRAGVCRDAEGGIHGGRRIPLRASRSARQALRRSGGARASHRRLPRAPRASRSRCLPVFYAHADFGGAPPTDGQRRFVHTVDSFAALVATLARDAAAAEVECRRRAAQPARRDAGRAGGDRRRWCRARAPIHIHAAEQAREVAACVAWSGARPVEWLLDARGTRRALVRRARDAHDGRRDTPPRRERRGRGSRADDRGGSR